VKLFFPVTVDRRPSAGMGPAPLQTHKSYPQPARNEVESAILRPKGAKLGVFLRKMAFLRGWRAAGASQRPHHVNAPERGPKAEKNIAAARHKVPEIGWPRSNLNGLGSASALRLRYRAQIA
jgi:hypothetical protein